MAAPLFRDVQPGVVAGEAQILVRLTGNRLQQLVLIVRTVRIVTRDTIANRRTVNSSLDLGGILIGVALKAKFSCRWGSELYVGGISGDPHLVAAGTSDRNCGMYGLALRLSVVAFKTFGIVGFGAERRMGSRICRNRAQEQNQEQRRQVGNDDSGTAQRHISHSRTRACRQVPGDANFPMLVEADH